LPLSSTCVRWGLRSLGGLLLLLLRPAATYGSWLSLPSISFASASPFPIFLPEAQAPFRSTMVLRSWDTLNQSVSNIHHRCLTNAQTTVEWIWGVVSDKNDEKALKICLSRPCAPSGNSDAKAVNSLLPSLSFFGCEYRVGIAKPMPPTGRCVLFQQPL